MEIVLAIVIDLLLLGIVALGIYAGIKDGFIKMAAKSFKNIFALIFAYFCCAPFAQFVVSPIIRTPINGLVSDFMYKNMPDVDPTTAANELPTVLKMLASAFGVEVAGEAANGSTYIDTLASTMSEPVVGFIAIIISAIALFFIGKLLFTFVFFLLNKFCAAGLLGKINKALGMVFGAFTFLVTACGVAALISIAFNLPVFDGNELISGFEGGFVYQFFNTFNPIELLLSF